MIFMIVLVQIVEATSLLQVRSSAVCIESGGWSGASRNGHHVGLSNFNVRSNGNGGVRLGKGSSDRNGRGLGGYAVVCWGSFRSSNGFSFSLSFGNSNGFSNTSSGGRNQSFGVSSRRIGNGDKSGDGRSGFRLFFSRG